MEEKKDKKDYKYYAFISYTEADYDMVKWLHHKLEFYHIPTKMRKKYPQVPEKWKIFEYKSEMKGGYLEEEIHKALDNSKYLIVVCSPNVRESSAVEDEIKYFIGSRKEDAKIREAHVIPFVIEGEAKSKNPKKECFPDPLLKTDLRGISINEQGRDAAAVKVIAQMFGLEFDELWQRYNREMRRKRNITYLGVIAFAFVSLIVALWMWHLKNQVTQTNQELIKENIRISSREILTLLEKGQYVDAKHQVESIVDLWKKECGQDVPEMEKALRAFYRYEWKDGIVKLYSIPLSDEQQFLSADSNYLYIVDFSRGNERIISYTKASGDSAKQIFPPKDQKIKYPIRGFMHGLVLCKNMRQNLGGYDIYHGPPDTICIYDSQSGKMILKKTGRYKRETILDKDKILLERYDTLSRKTSLELVQISNGHMICQWSSPFEYGYNLAFLKSDSLTVIEGNKVVVYDIDDGKLLCNLDYKKEAMESWYVPVRYSNINSSTRQFANTSQYGLRLFSTDKHNCDVLDKSGDYSYLAYNPSGTMMAAVKNGGKDSILVFFTGYKIPIFSFEGDDIDQLFFADDLTFVEREQHRINVYSFYADLFSCQLYSSTGNYQAFLNKNTGNFVEIINDSTDEIICNIKNPDEITNVYGFSPQDTYLMYATTKNPMVLYHIKENKDIVIPIKWEALSHNSWNYDMSDDESTFFSIEDFGNSCLAAWFDIIKNGEVIDYIKITQDIYHPLSSALSANGQNIALSDGLKIYLYETDSLRKDSDAISIEEIGNCSVRNLCFSKGDSRILAASYSDGTIRFWDTSTGEQLYHTIQSGVDNGSLEIDMSNDSRYLVGTSRLDIDNWEYLIWHIPSGILVDKETNAWSWWAKSMLQDKLATPNYRARFARNSNEIIVNDHNLLGLSRKFPFPSFDELIKMYSKNSDE